MPGSLIFDLQEFFDRGRICLTHRRASLTCCAKCMTAASALPWSPDNTAKREHSTRPLGQFAPSSLTDEDRHLCGRSREISFCPLTHLDISVTQPRLRRKRRHTRLG